MKQGQLSSEPREERRLRASHNATSWATASGMGLSPATHRRTLKGEQARARQRNDRRSIARQAAVLMA